MTRPQDPTVMTGGRRGPDVDDTRPPPPSGTLTDGRVLKGIPFRSKNEKSLSTVTGPVSSRKYLRRKSILRAQPQLGKSLH